MTCVYRASFNDVSHQHHNYKTYLKHYCNVNISNHVHPTPPNTAIGARSHLLKQEDKACLFSAFKEYINFTNSYFTYAAVF